MPFNIGRREFIAVLGGAAASPLSARAQQLPGRTARIGLLQTSRDNPVVGRGYPAFLDELKKSGFSAGQNLTIEVVRTDQDSQRLFAETADLVRSNVELLVAEGTEIVLKAALAASRTIPIVISAINYDPIAHGYVKSLARPGGNITGIVTLQTELAAKQVELLAEAFPDRSRLAVQRTDAYRRVRCEGRSHARHLELATLRWKRRRYARKAYMQLCTGGALSS